MTFGQQGAPAGREVVRGRQRIGLYDPRHEHDACGVGFVADLTGHRSHHILKSGIESVVNVTHRGAVSADGKSGDGAGVLTQLPIKLLRREIDRLGGRLDRPDDLAVGMIFFPQADPTGADVARQALEEEVAALGLHLIGWRPVPVRADALGAKSAATQPRIEQMLIGRGVRMAPDAFERALYRARKRAERRVEEQGIEDFYIPSFSSRTLVYKGLLVAPQLARFYPDLEDPDYQTALCVFHQRYSTNTFPNWFLAQPFRLLAHNGEINTLQGNRNWMRAREPELESAIWGDAVRDVVPTIWSQGSDSASLDNALELVTLSGRDLLHAMMMLVPEAWENMPGMDAARKAFYAYHACLMEPWDGPAALAFSDGRIVGATLDRNGLRPARYAITEDDIIFMGSEVGVVDLDPATIREKGRLGPGEMIAVDTTERRLFYNDDVKDLVAGERPYGQWVHNQVFHLEDHLGHAGHGLRAAGNGRGANGGGPSSSLRQQRAYGFTAEEIPLVLRPMVGSVQEPTWSMGDDTPLAVLTTRPRLLSAYFKQKFAQVTNPPIDHLREALVMSLDTYLGPRASILEETEQHAKLIHLSGPVLLDHELRALTKLKDPTFKAATVSTLFRLDDAPQSDDRGPLEAALDRICDEAAAAVEAGASLIVLSDRGVDAEHASVPMLLATGAVHHALIRSGLRMRASLICETGEAWEVHHFATLIGYGASAVNPYLVFDVIASMLEGGEVEDIDFETAVGNFKKSSHKSLLKVMSKMGISALRSYQGAQIFEAIGLSDEVVERAFTGTDCRVSGIGFAEIEQEVRARHALGYQSPDAAKLEDVGFYRFRKGGEYHAFNPALVRQMHKLANSNKPEDYQEYLRLATEHEPVALRELFQFRWAQQPVPIEEVEPIEEITRRFEASAMSIGALGPEAHEDMAIAMNRIGGKSNSGEGGEEKRRFRSPKTSGAVDSNSRVKQVASGRFGVTPEYLASADEIQIKMAQGSKPGEGGQLPGHKVVEHIAVIRHTVPGVTLISPPPHHDIYSIEDLAQLIYDLKQVNPRARVSVKLVAEAGVGTIAAGVAKAYADVVTISGHVGGTGASPLSSIKNAGTPWELGLSETQQVLVLNDLRGRILVRTDGGLKTGRDVVMAALLGAEEFAFGTAAAVALGCQMARQCHLNTCPVGIATQRADLRAKYKGKPEMVVTFFIHLAEEIRQLLARLGARSLEEIIGRTDLLEQIALPGHPKANLLDLSAILAQADPTGTLPRRRIGPRNDRPDDDPLDDQILADAAAAIDRCEPIDLRYHLTNRNRAVGVKTSGEIAHRRGDEGLPDGTLRLHLTGTAGQTLGGFLVPGVEIRLEGEANDYVGKGMHGGLIVIRPPRQSRFASHENAIAGNTVLYGATGGHLFAAGRVGERFCVRNSGAKAVVEGIGDHGCEYMTAGTVVVLGETGRNFGAGMSGGTAYVLDEAEQFLLRYNPEMVGLERVTEDPAAEAELHELIVRHLEETGSARAEEILADWARCRDHFWRVVPHPPEAKAPVGATSVPEKAGQRLSKV
ncbi:MAG TPA: glutamate synthase large subunit [Dehalococcoidia bacterium]|nr:glutamate synthase large subunit [Dehalococcoidia bacterium]